MTLWVTLGSANVVELLAARRPYAMLLDREHTTCSLGDIHAMTLAADNARVTSLVRVPGPDRHEVGRLLDAGTYGMCFVASPARPKPARLRRAFGIRRVGHVVGPEAT